MKKILLAFTILLTFTAAQAQNDGFDLGQLLEGGIPDGKTLIQNYMQPAFDGFGNGLNAGWYNTGKPHKLLGIDITFGPVLAKIPSSRNYFRFNADAYENVTLGMPENYGKTDLATSLYDDGKLPTFAGPNLDADDIPYLIFNEGTENEFGVTAPTGVGMDEHPSIPFVAVPAAYIQAGIGLVKGTEIKLRYLPNVGTDDFTINMKGFGVMHDIKQWIPGIKNMPFDLSGFFAINNIHAEGLIREDDPNTTADEKQSWELSATGTTMQGIISKELAILTVYGGVGYAVSGAKFKMLGYYDQLPEEIPDEEKMDPITLESKGIGGMKANIGFRLKLLILTLHAEYAFQEYQTITAGIGLSVR